MLLMTASQKKSDSRDNDVVRPLVVRSERLSDANQMPGDVSSPRQHVAEGFQRLLDLAWEQTLLTYTSRTSRRRCGSEAFTEVDRMFKILLDADSSTRGLHSEAVVRDNQRSCL